MSDLFGHFVEAVRKRIPYAIDKIEYYKRNDECVHGIRLLAGDDVCPTVPVDVEKLTNENFDSLVEEYVRFMTDNVPVIPDNLPTHGLCKENIVFILLNPDYNKHYLEDVTTVKFNNLVLVPVYREQLGDEREVTVVCNDSVCKDIGIDIENDYDLIVENTLRRDPVKFSSLESLLEFNTEIAGGMWVVTSESGYVGAVAAALTGVRELAMKLEANIFVLPSSVHELLCLSETTVYDICAGSVKELKQMVKSVNDDCISQSDLLSDSVYLYHVDKNEWEVF